MDQFTLAIEENPEIEVPVDFTLKQGGVNKKFAFTIIATRVPFEEQEEKMNEAGNRYREGLLAMGIITGWKNQRLVLGADGKPAEFSEAALDCMLRAPGVAMIIFLAYTKECNAKAKN